MDDEKTAELKNKISELKHRLNQMYAQYFSDTREGKVFETEFSLYVKASEHARREKSEHMRLQYKIMQTGIVTLLASSALIIFLFKQQFLFSIFFLLGLGFFAWGFMYLLLAAEKKIARIDSFCSSLARYFQQHRWNTDSKQALHLPDIPLLEESSAQSNSMAPGSSHDEQKALYIPFRIAISFIDLLALIVLIQLPISGETTIGKFFLIICFMLWLAAIIVHMLLVHTIVNHTEIIRKPHDKHIMKGSWTARNFRGFRSLTLVPRLFFLLDILFPEAPTTSRNTGQFQENDEKS